MASDDKKFSLEKYLEKVKSTETILYVGVLLRICNFLPHIIAIFYQTGRATLNITDTL